MIRNPVCDVEGCREAHRPPVVAVAPTEDEIRAKYGPEKQPRNVPIWISHAQFRMAIAALQAATDLSWIRPEPEVEIILSYLVEHLTQLQQAFAKELERIRSSDRDSRNHN